jgi:hypothetical protein
MLAATAEASLAGSALTMPHPAIPPAPITPAVRATRAEATLAEVTVGEAATAVAGVVGAISSPRHSSKDRHAAALFPKFYSRSFLDSFQSEYRISLESLEKTVFPFASGRGLKYRMGSVSPKGPPVS